MPLYDYECPKCGFKKEVMKKLDELLDIVECEECGYLMKRLVGNRGGFRLKGGGWGDEGYATLYGDARKFKSS